MQLYYEECCANIHNDGYMVGAFFFAIHAMMHVAIHVGLLENCVIMCFMLCNNGRVCFSTKKKTKQGK
jgi:hypothetical protein